MAAGPAPAYQILPAETGAAAWRLQLVGPTGRTATLRREELLTIAMVTEDAQKHRRSLR